MTDIHSCSYYCERPACIKAQRDKLREALAQPAPLPVQEPVAWITPHGQGWQFRWSPPVNDVPLGWDALYASPPRRHPLTDAEIKNMDCRVEFDEHLRVVKMTEAAHNIGAKP
jgi:hypothetical protein